MNATLAVSIHKRLSLSTLITLLILFISSEVNAVTEREYALKSGFILNFARYSSNLVSEQEASLIICSSDASFLSIAKETLKNYRIRDKNIVIKHAATNNYKTESCHIVFVSKDEQPLWKNTLQHTSNDKILFIGEDRGFLRYGGHIRFLISAGKIRFEVATQRLKKSNINLSSKVIRLGFVYEGKQL